MDALFRARLGQHDAHRCAEPIALIDATGVSEVTYYYHRNRQFSIVGLTDSTGTVIERYAYDGYGDPTLLAADGVTVRTTSSYGNTYLHTGRRYDPESALYYYRARMYDAQLGQFIQRDPLGYPDGMNSYAAYHVMHGGVDPSGKINASEKLWCCNNKICCAAAWRIKKDLQTQMSVRYPGWRDNTVENAVHHCAWMCATTASWVCTAGQARRLGQAHENYRGNPAHDKAMDLHNNEVGIGLAKNGDSVARCITKCEAAAGGYNLYWHDPVAAPGPRNGLPGDYPGFTLNTDGTINVGAHGTNSPTAPGPPAPPAARPSP